MFVCSFCCRCCFITSAAIVVFVTRTVIVAVGVVVFTSSAHAFEVAATFAAV